MGAKVPGELRLDDASRAGPGAPSLKVASFGGPPAEWDGFVRSVAGWTHFHLMGWRRVFQSVLGHECLYLAARRGSSLCGVLPLVRVNSLVFGHYLMSLPFVNYGGPLGEGDAVRTLTAWAVHQARADGVKLLELRNRQSMDTDLPASQRKVTVVLDLPSGSPAPLWEGLAAKVRSQVRRPQKEGVVVRFGADQVGPFYAVFARHMRDLGTPAQSRRLFECLAETFADDVWFGCAYLGNRAIAGGCGLRWASEFEMTWASALREYNSIAPNMLLYWSFMERCVADGVKTFNFGRCTPGGGTHRFKRQWGGRDEPLWWYQWSPGGMDATPSPEDPRYAWGPRLWRFLPVRVATALGPRIVRHLP